MRLAIADPPYPPNLLSNTHGPQNRASRYYGETGDKRWYGAASTQRRRETRPADVHPEAAEWDDPARHWQLMVELMDSFDGWVIATTPDAVATVYAPPPVGTRILTWVKTNGLPTGHRIGSRCESVIAYVPEARRRVGPAGQVPDFLIHASPRSGFAGAKPLAWTRWVLDALGYDQDVDTVADVFPGSGAVAAAIAQGVLL